MITKTNGIVIAMKAEPCAISPACVMLEKTSDEISGERKLGLRSIAYG